MPVRGPVRGFICGWRGGVCSGILTFVFFAGFAQAQDVAEAARQERARKVEQKKPSKHVYTDEDLKRDKILIPEDQARVEARKKQQGTEPAEQNAQSRPDNAAPQQESLGEVARRYRREKAARESEEVRKKKFSPFPYKIPDASLATPKIEVAPRSEPKPPLVSREKNAPNVLAPPRASTNGNGVRPRISPFQPRPHVVTHPPVRVAPSAPTVSPTIRVQPANPPALPSVNVAPVMPSVPPVIPRNVQPVPVAPTRVAEPAGLRRVEVQRGDCWWKLSERFLGSGARWPELRSLNPEVSGPPELLRMGRAVLVPAERTTRTSPRGAGIVVKPGDSLWAIARAHFGRGSAWVCLAQANPQVSDYRRMAIGTILQMPSSEALQACFADASATPRK